MAYDDEIEESDPSGGGAMPGDAAGAAPDDDAKLYRKLVKWYKEDIEVARKWRKQAKTAYQFYNGDQWTAEEKAYLEGQKRPTTVFNYIANLVNAVVGSEIGNRREVRYIPREQGDSLANELLTSAGEWFRDQSDAEDEESDAYKDNVIAGMGWTETRLSTDDDPDAEPVINRIDGFEMGWDRCATKSNLVDARRIWRTRSDLSMEQAVAMFPGIAKSDLNATFAGTNSGSTSYTDKPGGLNYVDGQDTDEGDALPKRLTIVECQWIEDEPYYRVLDPATGQLVDMQADRYEMLSQAAAANGFQLKGIPAKRKIVMRAFLGAKVLESGPSPYGQHFSYQAMTGYFDRNEGIFYGIVKNAIDPQVWSNKLHSQIMHIMNSSAKGGIMAEEGAFEDIREAEKTWAQPDGITKVNDGALSGPNGPKIHPKPQVQLPAGYFTMKQDASSAVREVTGINLELLGMREATQAGVLEYQRRQAGIATLGQLFNALRRYRKRQGRLMLYIIQTYLSDGRLIRVVGDDKKQYVPLTKPDRADVRYDIIVDDAPTSPNEKERTFSIIMQMLPQIMAMKPPPEVMLEMMKYSPLPASLVEKLAKLVEEQKNKPSPEADLRKQIELESAQAKIAKDKGSAVQSEASAKLDEAKAETERMKAFATMVGEYLGGMGPTTIPM